MAEIMHQICVPAVRISFKRREIAVTVFIGILILVDFVFQIMLAIDNVRPKTILNEGQAFTIILILKII